MQWKLAKGLSASLIAGGLATLLSGCDTPRVPDPFAGKPPKIVAIYAVDFVGGNIGSNDPRSGVGNNPLQDVLIYTTVDADKAKVSAAPPSYGAFRIEFDEPMDGTSLGANNDLNLSGNSFCTPPSGGASVQVLDGATNLPSSVCYDPTSNLGQNPHVLVTLGSSVGTTTSGTIPNPFTCHDFNADYGNGPGLSALQNKHPYSFKFAGLKSSGGLALDPSTPASIPFTSAGFEIMAVGYQDQNTGYFHWLAKPFPGYMKDLAAEGSAFAMPHDSTPLIVITTYGTKGVTTEEGTGDVSSAAGSVQAEFTLTRAADGSSPGAAGAFPEIVGLDLYGTLLAGATLYVFDPRVTNVTVGDTWEPGVQYKLAITGAFAGDDGTTISAPATFTFSAAAGSLAILSNFPANGATSVEPATLSPSGSTGPGHPGGSGFYTTPVVIEFQAPVDTTGCSADGSDCTGSTNISAANFIIKDATGTAIPGAFHTGTDYSVGAPGAPLNNQFVQFDPTSPLPLSTTINVTVQNVKAATMASLGSLSGGVFPTTSFTFSTGNFRINRIRDPNQPSITSATIDRVTVVPPQDMLGGSVYVEFTDAADGTTVTPANIAVTEVNTDGTTKVVDPAKYTFVARSGGPATGARWKFEITDTSYALKFNQGYRFTASTAVKSKAGVALKAEACAGTDCSDSRTFSTLQFGLGCYPGLFNSPDPTAGCRAIEKTADASGNINGISVRFNEPVQASSLPADLTTAVTLTAVNADGSTAKVSDLTCTTALENAGAKPPAGDVDAITCTSPSLKGNQKYTATALFTQTHPVKVSATLNGQPTDQTSGTFFGSSTRTFTTPCP